MFLINWNLVRFLTFSHGFGKMALLKSTSDFANVPVVWKPKTTNDNYRIKEFGQRVSSKYNIKIENYSDLHRWSVEHIPEFWAEMWDYFGVIHSRTYEEVIDMNVNIAENPMWFKGARLNYAENSLRYRDDHTALIMDGEDREVKKVSYAQLYDEVCKFGASLKKLGLEKNDTVACYMSNREEAIFAMFATTAAGARWTAALPFIGAKAVLGRFRQVNPKFLFAVDRFVYEGEEYLQIPKLVEIANALPSLKKIIIVRTKSSEDISGVRNSCSLEEFLACGLDNKGTVPELEFEQLPFDHPTFVNYTSGTTGLPKALVHGNGIFLSGFQCFGLHGNMTRDTIFLSTSPAGWVSWNMATLMIPCGVTIVLYDGAPFLLSPTSIWDLTDKHRISDIFIVPSCLDALEKQGYFPTEKHDLSSLKCVWTGASIVKKSNYDFVYKKIKADMFLNEIYGATELMGPCALSERTIECRETEISAVLGQMIQCLDENGKAIEGEMGELVITTPLPFFLLSIIGDPDRKIYRNAYFSKFPGHFSPGDSCIINPITKGIRICGRSDETLKQNGERFGSSEIYNVVSIFPEIEDSLCTSQYNDMGDSRAVLFLKLTPGHLFTSAFVHKVQNAIKKELSRDHVPQVILQTKSIPYNMNGKKMEIIVKKIINKMEYSTESIINKECLKSYQNIPELQDFK